MAKISIFNIGKANAEINSGHEAADAALVAGKITTLKVDGKDVPAGDAPLAIKIAAVASLAASGEKTQDVSELIATNGQIASQVEELTNKLAVANSTVASNGQKISALESELTTSKASVQSLTADLTTHKNLLEASNKEATRLTSVVNSNKSALASRCVAANCLDFSSLAKDATEADKISAAEKMSFDDLFKAYNGAVNAAVAKTGVSFASVPAAPLTATAGEKPEAKGRDRFNAAAKNALPPHLKSK